MSRHTHPKAGATAPRCPSPGLGNDDPPKSPFAPQTQRLRPPAPGIQESVPSSLGSSFPFLLHFLVFSRTFPLSPQGPRVKLNKCAFVFPPFCLCVVVCGHPRTGWETEVVVLFLPSSSFPPSPPQEPHLLTTSFLPDLPKGPSLLFILVPICVPQTLQWRPPPSVPHHPPPLLLPPLPVGPGSRRGND